MVLYANPFFIFIRLNLDYFSLTLKFHTRQRICLWQPTGVILHSGFINSWVFNAEMAFCDCKYILIGLQPTGSRQQKKKIKRLKRVKLCFNGVTATIWGGADLLGNYYYLISCWPPSFLWNSTLRKHTSKKACCGSNIHPLQRLKK